MKCALCDKEIEIGDLYFYSPTKGFFCDDCVKLDSSEEEDK